MSCGVLVSSLLSRFLPPVCKTPLRDQAGLITAVLSVALPVAAATSTLSLLATAAAHHGGVPWTPSTTGRTLAMHSSTRCRNFASPENWRVRRLGESFLTSMRYVQYSSSTSGNLHRLTAVNGGSGHSRQRENSRCRVRVTATAVHFDYFAHLDSSCTKECACVMLRELAARVVAMSREKYRLRRQRGKHRYCSEGG